MGVQAKREALDYLRTFLPPEDQWLADRLVEIRRDADGKMRARRDRRNVAKRRRMQIPSQRIRNAMSARMWAALKGRKDAPLFSRLGYSLEALMQHLEGRFQPGMSWANYGEWHVDHRRPCAKFDLTDPRQFAECWALSNLQPLWGPDNIRKGARDG